MVVLVRLRGKILLKNYSTKEDVLYGPCEENLELVEVKNPLVKESAAYKPKPWWVVKGTTIGATIQHWKNQINDPDQERTLDDDEDVSCIFRKAS